MHRLLRWCGLRLDHEALERDGRVALGRWAKECLRPPLRKLSKARPDRVSSIPVSLGFEPASLGHTKASLSAVQESSASRCTMGKERTKVASTVCGNLVVNLSEPHLAGVGRVCKGCRGVRGVRCRRRCSYVVNLSEPHIGPSPLGSAPARSVSQCTK